MRRVEHVLHEAGKAFAKRLDLMVVWLTRLTNHRFAYGNKAAQVLFGGLVDGHRVGLARTLCSKSENLGPEPLEELFCVPYRRVGPAKCKQERLTERGHLRLGHERTAAVLNVDEPTGREHAGCVSDHATTHTKLIGEFRLSGQCIPRPESPGNDLLGECVGELSDLWGRRKTYTLGATADLVSSCLILVAPSPAVAIVAFGFRGAGRAFVSGSLDALAIDTIRQESPGYDLQVFFSRVGMAVPAGLAVSSLAGGFLPELGNLPLLRSVVAWSPAKGFSVNMLASVLLVSLATALAWLLFEEAPRRKNDVSGVHAVLKQVFSSVRFGMRTRGLNLLLLSSVAAGLVLLSVETFWQPRLDHITASENVRIFGLLGSGYFAAAVLGSAGSPVLIGILGGNRALGAMIARIASAAALAVLAVQTTATGFSALYLLFFFFFAGATPAHSTMLNELVPDERRSTMLSISSLLLQAGGFVGSLVFGTISQAFGIHASWLIAAAVFALSTLLFLPLVGDGVARVDRM